MSDVPCTCAAFDERDPHTEADHRFDCPGSGPDLCGGCWGCLALTVHYWNRKRAAQNESQAVES